MGSVKTLNPNAEVMGRNAALFMNINAAKGLYEVMKTNFGPKGTIKMLVGGAGGALVHGIGLCACVEASVRGRGHCNSSQPMRGRSAARRKLRSGCTCSSTGWCRPLGRPHARHCLCWRSLR